jgi:hypothetical protein
MAPVVLGGHEHFNDIVGQIIQQARAIDKKIHRSSEQDKTWAELTTLSVGRRTSAGDTLITTKTA